MRSSLDVGFLMKASLRGTIFLEESIVEMMSLLEVADAGILNGQPFQMDVRIGLDAGATEAWALAEPWLEADPYKEYSVETGQYYYEYTLSLLESWPEAVAGELFPAGEPILGN